MVPVRLETSDSGGVRCESRDVGTKTKRRPAYNLQSVAMRMPRPATSPVQWWEGAPRWAQWTLAGAIVYLVLMAVYWPAMNAWFVSDDYRWLLEEPWERVAATFWGPWGHLGAYRPLARVSLTLDRLLFGWNPLGWHLVSLGFHAANVLLVYALARRLRLSWVAAVAAALLFGTSALASDNVAWISARNFAMATTFGLGALLLWFAFLNRPAVYKLLLAGLGFAAALMSYEGAVAFAVAFPAITLWNRRGRPWRALALPLAVLTIALPLVYVAFRSWALSGQGGLNPSWPLVQALTFNVPLAGQLFLTYGAVLLISLSLTLVLLLATKDRSRAEVFLGLLALALLAYVPFVTIIGVAPRFFYLASVPLSLAAAVGVDAAWSSRWSGRRAALASLLVGGVLVQLVVVHAVATQWAQAGSQARSILESFRALVPTAEHDTYLVSGVPNDIGRIPIFVTYFEFAVAISYPQPFPGAIYKLPYSADSELMQRAPFGLVRTFRVVDGETLEQDPIDWLADSGLLGIRSDQVSTVSPTAIWDQGPRLHETRILNNGNEASVRTLWTTSQSVQQDDWVLFVHVREPNGDLCAQADAPLGAAVSRRSRQWNAGETIFDQRAVDLSACDSSLDLSVVLGFYDPQGLKRYPLASESEVVVGQVTVR
jgi:hypothetical protein